MRIGWLKFHYLIVYAILGCLLPYLSIYATGRGLSGSEIGWVYGVFGIAVMVAPPIYTALADRFAANRTLIAACYGLGGAALVGLTFADSFVGILAMHLLFALMFTAMVPLLDGLTFATIHPPVDASTGLEVGEPRTPYRAIRIWGSYGWMMPGLLFPWMLLADFDAQTVSRLAIASGAGFGLMGLVACRALPRGHLDGGRARALPTADAFRALLRRDLRVLIAALFLMFMSISVYYAFYPPYLEMLGVRSELVGLITNIGVTVEIGCMLISGRLIARFGMRGVLILGAACQVARMALLAAAPSAAAGIASQVFHGPTVLALYLIPPMYLNAHADGRFRSSMQGLYAMLCFGAARIVGSAIGGSVNDAFSPPTAAGYAAVFWLAAGFALVGLVTLAARFRPMPTASPTQSL